MHKDNPINLICKITAHFFFRVHINIRAEHYPTSLANQRNIFKKTDKTAYFINQIEAKIATFDINIEYAYFSLGLRNTTICVKKITELLQIDFFYYICI